MKKSEEGSASMSGAGAKVDLGGQVKTRKGWLTLKGQSQHKLYFMLLIFLASNYT